MNPQELENYCKEQWRLSPITRRGLVIRGLVVVIILLTPFLIWLI